jgi:hypothetical protein
MAKAAGKRGHKKAEEALSRKATQHHDFVGQAEAERAESRAVEEARIRRDQEQLEKEVVHEMAQELEQMAEAAETKASPASSHGVAAEIPRGPTPSSEPRTTIEIPTSVQEAVDLLRQRGPEVLETMRAKAEERLEQMPQPIKGAIHLTERAFGLALWPIRTGVHLMGRMLETPVALLRILLARRTA